MKPADNEKIANYKILEKIGEGGMAIIYKAYQPSLKRNVVIKKLKDPNREIIARFKKEALLSASFTQENVIAIYDFIYANRAYYLVMEHVDGEDLRTIMDGLSPMPVELAILITLELAQGLEYTHNQNIIHRDIKPGNILISAEGNVKLIDFGVAKDDSISQITMTGLIVGTPAYMSPEQAHGDTLGPQSDLYALGILLYEMLTGLKPYYGSNNTEILAKVVRGKYIPAQRINPEIGFKLQRIIKKLLKKDRRKRYKNAAQLVHDLEQCLPWQVRSAKKKIISKHIKNLDKTTITYSDDTLKAALLERASGYGWRALHWGLTCATIISAVALFNQFRQKELGFIQLRAHTPNMEIALNNTPIASSNNVLGPYLNGVYALNASDPIRNATFHTQTVVKANDTTIVEIDIPLNPASSTVKLSAMPPARIDLDGLAITPQQAISIEPGWHRITVKKEGYQTYTQNHFLRASESYVMHFNLIPITEK